MLLATTTIASLSSGPYPQLITFLGALIGGEETIMIVAGVASTGWASFGSVMAFSFLGTLCSDLFFFFLARHRFLDWLKRFHIFNRSFEKLSLVVKTFSGNNDFLALLITKFIYGTRILTIIYLSCERMDTRRFLAYNSAVTVTWLFVIVPIGWFVGRGFQFMVAALHNVQTGLLIVAVVAVIFFLLRIKVNKWLVRKQNRLL